MAGCPRERDRTHSSDGNSQHHRGVLEEDAPLAAGVKRQAFGGHRPTLTPTSRRRALSCRTPMGGSGTINRKRLLIRPRPFMYGDRGQAVGSSASVKIGG
jgi:hypothetical protein